jgi:hypothetical protein
VLEPNEIQEVLKLSVMVVIGIIIIVVFYIGIRRKIEKDRLDLEALKSEKMKDHIEALAAMKIAEREKKEAIGESEPGKGCDSCCGEGPDTFLNPPDEF